MVKNEDGSVRQGSLARVEPEGETMRMWEAIETYMNRKQPLIIIAGADYGQGSSRDWAAKGVRLAGVEAIAAEGFERIHRTNLIGMGVLPLQFKPGTNRHTLQLDGTETYDVVGERKPRGDLTLVIHRKPSKSPLPAASIPQRKCWCTKPAACCNGLHRTFWKGTRLRGRLKIRRNVGRIQHFAHSRNFRYGRHLL